MYIVRLSRRVRPVVAVVVLCSSVRPVVVVVVVRPLSVRPGVVVRPLTVRLVVRLVMTHMTSHYS